MSKNITIVGSGTTALGAAAMFTFMGHKVTLTDVEERAAVYETVREKGGILVRGNGPRGLAMPECMTSDVAGAVSGADVIIISVVGNRHDEIAKIVGPAVKDGQVITIAPGNAGSILFVNEIKKAGNATDVPVLEAQNNLFSSRITGPGEINAARGLKKCRASAFPAKDTAKAIERMEGVMEFEPAKNIFDTTLNEANVLNHLGASILNASLIDKMDGKFGLFSDGLTPTVIKGLECSWRDYKAVVDALGYMSKGDPTGHWRKLAEYDQHPEMDVFRSLGGPDTMQHRYITEDAQVSVSLLVSVARKLGISIPYTEGMVAIASGLNDTDYYGQGRTLENLGLADMTMAEIEEYLETGEK